MTTLTDKFPTLPDIAERIHQLAETLTPAAKTDVKRCLARHNVPFTLAGAVAAFVAGFRLMAGMPEFLPDECNDPIIRENPPSPELLALADAAGAELVSVAAKHLPDRNAGIAAGVALMRVAAEAMITCSLDEQLMAVMPAVNRLPC